MSPQQFQDLLDRFTRGACTPEEEQFVIDWYDKLENPDQPVLSDREKETLSESIWSAIKPEERRSVWLPLLAKAAAVTIPLLVVAFFYFRPHPIPELITGIQEEPILSTAQQNRIVNDGATARKIHLPDSSVVILQPSSEILIADAFNDTIREMRLKGEAFFKVTRDANKPFVVYSNEVVTRVLGTSFNIRAYEDDGEITVAVKTGKVSVCANKAKVSSDKPDRDSKEVILTPNQQIVYHRISEEVFKELVEKPEIILPNSNLFRMQFENVEVAKILAVLERNYGIDIRFDEGMLKDCKLTTSMSDEGLYERIEVICKAIGASYRIDEDAVITIISNGC